MNKSSILTCQNLSKTYSDGYQQVNVFENLNFSVAAGEQIAIMGRSGSGKSTLLHLLGGLEKPSTGKVLLEGKNFYQLSEKKRACIRNRKLGFIYQLHHLLPEFTVLENVCMPLLLQNVPIQLIIEKAQYLLQKVGLEHRLKHKITELSGGERQRTAIVRALINDPSCVLADEPTGNLDSETALKVYQTILALNQEFNTTFIIVTHDRMIANKMDRIVELVNGQLIAVKN